MTNQQLWQAALAEIELSLSKPNFNTWFRQTSISSFENGKIVISVPNTFTKAWLEKKYHQAIFKSLRNLTGDSLKEVVYKVEIVKQQPKIDLEKPPTFKPQQMSEEKKQEPITSAANPFGLNPKYTFQNFIVGKGNELAHAACQAIVKNPGKVYNPLFIYGGVGLGKTHLLQAVGNAIIEKSPQMRVLYTTCEKFTNDYIQSIRNNSTEQFKKIYRSPDVLLVDDVQFMAAKEGTQEEFFHTFNDLYNADKQIVITSDRSPKAIPALEQRLISRFLCGMIADISQPDFETRIAILKAKCKEKNLLLSPEIINYIASNIQSNIRELEGALNKILIYQQFHKTAIDLEKIKSILMVQESSTQKRSLTPKQLIQIVAEYYDLNVDDLLGESREQKLAFPRQIIMYLMREELRYSFPAIGQELGGRDHTTALHAFNKISQKIENDEKIRQEIEQIKQRLFAFRV
jgi:chromosomal replication initiator protein